MGEPPEAVKDLDAGQGRQRGDEQTRSDGRDRNAAQGAETSGRGWWEVGMDNIQVDGVPLKERRWGARETEGFYNE